MGISAFILTAHGVSEQAEAAREQKDATGRQVSAQREQQKTQKKVADIKGQRERRRMIREQRSARSQVEVAGGGGSKQAGAVSSIGTQAASAVGFAGQQSRANQSIFEQGGVASAASKDIASASARGQIGGAFASLASTTFSIFGE